MNGVGKEHLPGAHGRRKSELNLSSDDKGNGGTLAVG